MNIYTKKFKYALFTSLISSSIWAIILLLLVIYFFKYNKKLIDLNILFFPLFLINLVSIILNIEVIFKYNVNKVKIIVSGIFQMISFTLIGFYSGTIFIKERNSNTLVKKTKEKMIKNL